jgi:hypothetical protein
MHEKKTVFINRIYNSSYQSVFSIGILINENWVLQDHGKIKCSKYYMWKKLKGTKRTACSIILLHFRSIRAKEIVWFGSAQNEDRLPKKHAHKPQHNKNTEHLKKKKKYIYI